MLETKTQGVPARGRRSSGLTGPQINCVSSPGSQSAEAAKAKLNGKAIIRIKALNLDKFMRHSSVV
jgi:hypothetical protein